MRTHRQDRRAQGRHAIEQPHRVDRMMEKRRSREFAERQADRAKPGDIRAAHHRQAEQQQQRQRIGDDCAQRSRDQIRGGQQTRRDDEQHQAALRGHDHVCAGDPVGGSSNHGHSHNRDTSISY
ncbi:hypothetical protein QP185_07770 [Sphingomonas aerolata]|uniref:hypothetical protein n=1 Tax=Sphingomonas aerolata TaxID=185951 RepID=UPI002FE1E3AC